MAADLGTKFDKKLVKVKEVRMATISVTCSRCKETSSLDVKTTNGHLNVDFQIHNNMKYAEVNATRDGRSVWSLKTHLLCQPCTKALIQFLDGADADLREVEAAFANTDEPTHLPEAQV